MPYPAAAAALLETLGRMAGLEVDVTALHAAGRSATQQIDQLVAGSEEHLSLVRQLEAQHDAEAAQNLSDMQDLPTGDELAAELERFLRGER